MSQPHTPSEPLSEESRSIVAALAQMLDDAADRHNQTASDRRYPSGYREADPEDIAEAAAYGAVADTFSSLAHDLRDRFDLNG